MMAIAVWTAIISLLGLIVSAAWLGHRQHIDPQWAAVDPQLDAYLREHLRTRHAKPVQLASRSTRRASRASSLPQQHGSAQRRAATNRFTRLMRQHQLKMPQPR